MIIDVNGQKIEIVNWDEFAKKLMEGIGFQVESEITKEINKLGLVDTGTFKERTSSKADSEGVTIDNNAPHAAYLEYGTYEYFNIYGLDRFPSTPDPKKKSLPPEARKGFPKGMQPFAPFRRVLYNPQKMEKLVEKGARTASR